MILVMYYPNSNQIKLWMNPTDVDKHQFGDEVIWWMLEFAIESGWVVIGEL